MSLLFDNQYNVEQRDKRQPPQHNGHRLVGGIKRHWESDNLLVFGYACSLFSEDAKAMFFDEGKHLIPWMGDESLMIDRYDGRLLLEDLTQFTRKDSFAREELSPEELDIERQCDEERYLALNENVADNEEEEEMKRFKAAIASEDSYCAVGFRYDEHYPLRSNDWSQQNAFHAQPYFPAYPEREAEILPEPPLSEPSNLKQPEVVEIFVPPEELGVPEGMEVRIIYEGANDVARTESLVVCINELNVAIVITNVAVIVSQLRHSNIEQILSIFFVLFLFGSVVCILGNYYFTGKIHIVLQTSLLFVQVAKHYVVML